MVKCVIDEFLKLIYTTNKNLLFHNDKTSLNILIKKYIILRREQIEWPYSAL